MTHLNSSTPSNASPIAGTLYFKKFADFDNQLLRAFAYDKDFGPAYGLCISTARRITEGDFDQWYEEWKASGDNLVLSARMSENKGHNESAKQNYLSASVCYRTADFFIRQNLEDKRIIPLADQQRETLRKGFEKFDFGIKVLDIPYENTTLDGYLFTVDKSEKSRPAIIFLGGYDSFVEETFYTGVYQALLRGYNVLSYDGPGQGQVLRRQKLYFRPDWENVSKPVIDFAQTLNEVDSKKIVMMGRSFSGYLAPRAMCFDKRPVALIADAALYDLSAGIKKMLTPEQYELLTENKDDKFNQSFTDFLKDKENNFYFYSRTSCHGVKTISEYIRTIMQFSLEGISKKITAPAFISCGEYDRFSVAQSQMLYDNINSTDKIYVEFKGIDGAGEHCESANQDMFYTTVFDWLDERIDP